MANRDGAVARLGVALHEYAHGQAHNLAAANNHAVLARRLDTAPADQLHDAVGRGGQVAVPTLDHAADIDRMEAIHVLFGADFLGHLVHGNVFGQRQLHNQPVHFGVLVDGFDDGQQFAFRNRVGIAVHRRPETDFCAGFHLVAHVGFAATIATHQHGHQIRYFSVPLPDCRHFRRNFKAHFLGYFLSVNELHGSVLNG